MEHPAWRPQSPTVTASDLDALCAKFDLAVVHCGPAWNAYDYQMDTLLQDIRAEFEDRIGFYAMDLNDERNWDFFRAANVVNIPALVCLAKLNRPETLIGLRPKLELRDLVEDDRVARSGHSGSCRCSG